MEKQFQRNLITADPDKAREGEVTAQIASAKVSLNRSSLDSRKFSSDRLCPYNRSSNQRKKERRGNG